MATIYTDIGSDQLPPNQADTWNRNAGETETGNLLVIDAQRTIASDASADVLRIAKVKANYRLVPHLCKIIAENPGTAYNIAKIGVTKVDASGAATDDDDKYSTAVNISAGGAFDFAYAAQAGAIDGSTETEDMWLEATLGTVTTPTAGATIRFVLVFAAAV